MTEQNNNQIESGGVAGPIGSPTPGQVGATASQSLAVDYETELALAIYDEYGGLRSPGRCQNEAARLLSRCPKLLGLILGALQTDSATAEATQDPQPAHQPDTSEGEA